MKRALLPALLCLSACSSYMPAPTAPLEDTYSRIFPYYIEQCAVSEINKTASFGATVESGGPGGHSLLYLNGVCRDTNAGYPVLKLCDDTTPAASQGVGLSVNDHFANANWVATPGQEFFFHGTVQPGEGLTKQSYDATEAAAEQMGIYDGVRFHDRVYQSMPAGMSLQDYTYDISIGTDYADDFARNRYCARVPVSKAQMEDTVRYLNRLNEPYRKGDKEFHWDVLLNNCTHMVHDALAAAGVWDAWPQTDWMVLAAFDFPVPKNEFVNLMRHAYGIDLTDPRAIYDDDALRDNFIRYGFLPDEPGVLAEFSPVIAPNDVYSTNSRLIFFDEAITGSYEYHFEEIYGDKRYTDLRTNLAYFSDLYGQVQQARKPLATDDPDFAAFYNDYYAYIDRMKQQTRRQSGLDGPHLGCCPLPSRTAPS